MKKYLPVFLTGIMVGVSLFVGVAISTEYSITPNPFPVKVNGEVMDIEGFNINGSSYFKLRDIAEAIGNYRVDFKDDTITINKEGVTMEETVMKDGLEIFNIEGIEYVRYVPLLLSLKELGYNLEVTKTAELELRKNNNIALSDIPFIIDQDQTHIPYAYYEEHIKPLLEAAE